MSNIHATKCDLSLYNRPVYIYYQIYYTWHQSWLLIIAGVIIRSIVRYHRRSYLQPAIITRTKSRDYVPAVTHKASCTPMRRARIVGVSDCPPANDRPLVEKKPQPWSQFDDKTLPIQTANNNYDIYTVRPWQLESRQNAFLYMSFR